MPHILQYSSLEQHTSPGLKRGAPRSKRRAEGSTRQVLELNCVMALWAIARAFRERLLCYVCFSDQSGSE